MNKVKKAISSVVALAACAVLTLGASAGFLRSGAQSASADTAKPIDMYLIAGQSNAAGYTYVGKNDKYELYDNVWYAGDVDHNFQYGYSSLNNTGKFEDFWHNTVFEVEEGNRMFGGFDLNHIGPEYGMSSIISQTATADHPAFIFKTAVGGVPLINRSRMNFYPRSLWKNGYVPNTKDGSGDTEGVLYQLFVENFANVYKELKAHGYEPQIKGMAWMQGEDEHNDSSLYEEYRKALKALIHDVREDVYAITKDENAKVMPFAIGEICESFGYYGNYRAVNFIENVQHRVVDEMNATGDTNVAIVETGDLQMFDETGKNIGSDEYHYGFKDAVKLGQYFANSLLEMNGKEVVIAEADNGTVKNTIANKTLTTTLTPDYHFKLGKLTLNDEDVTSQVQDGVFTTTLTKRVNEMKAEFIPLDNFKITYVYNEGAGAQKMPKVVYIGEKLELNVVTKKDYELVKVLFNGKEMTKNASGKYEIEVTENGTVEFVSKFTGVVVDDKKEEEPVEKSGCGSSLTAWSVPVAMGVAIALISPFLLKKKKNNEK